MLKSLRYAGPLLAFAVLIGFLFVGLYRDPRLVPSPLVGKPAPAFDLPTLSNASVRIDNQGLLGRPVLINVWASWCVACREEHPVLLQLARAGRLRIIGMDYKDKPEDAEAWLQHFGNPYEQVMTDRDGRVGINWGVYGVPESFLLSPQGTVLFKHVGPLTWDVLNTSILPRATATAGATP
jgi:cytochrome c biogenesis protein CcmG, thiol:disulfide interchange protein DsbE